MPYAAQIQAAFGSHDVSGIQAYQGGDAAAASKDIGARAYATGDKVAFGESPDLHTAAHEAAHVVQQRAGVSLKGGVGQSGDTYEQHADAVADLVVQGKSAEGLLDQYAGGTSSAGVQAKYVQREDLPTSDTESDPNAELFAFEARLVELEAELRVLEEELSAKDDEHQAIIDGAHQADAEASLGPGSDIDVTIQELEQRLDVVDSELTEKESKWFFKDNEGIARLQALQSSLQQTRGDLLTCQQDYQDLEAQEAALQEEMQSVQGGIADNPYEATYVNSENYAEYGFDSERSFDQACQNPPEPKQCEDVSNEHIPETNHQSACTFLKSDAIKDHPDGITMDIVNTIYPYYHRDDKVISGYLTDADQYWKVNWHVEAMLIRIDEALAIKAEDLREDSGGRPPKAPETFHATLQAAKASLQEVQSPVRGFFFSQAMGSPSESALNPSEAELKKRWSTMHAQKQRLASVHSKMQPWRYYAGDGSTMCLADGNPEKAFKLAFADVVNRPGTSKHGEGYALDIKGGKRSDRRGVKRCRRERRQRGTSSPRGVQKRRDETKLGPAVRWLLRQAR